MSADGPATAPDGVVVEEVTEVTPEVLDALRALVPELSSSAPPLTSPSSKRSCDRPRRCCSWHATPPGGTILGSLTLVVFNAPTGSRAWIEDVVVAPRTRGRGVGAALVREAVDRAAAAGSHTVDLTSRPSREAANRLYVRLGFVLRETNVYRRDLEAESARKNTPDPGAAEPSSSS